MGYLCYKGYYGSVEYDEKAGILRGRVQGLRDNLLNYNGMSLQELQKDFEESVNLYLEFCAKKKKDPERPYYGSLTVRLGPDLQARAVLMADRMGMSLNTFIKQAVSEFLIRQDERERF